MDVYWWKLLVDKRDERINVIWNVRRSMAGRAYTLGGISWVDLYIGFCAKLSYVMIVHNDNKWPIVSHSQCPEIPIHYLLITSMPVILIPKLSILIFTKLFDTIQNRTTHFLLINFDDDRDILIVDINKRQLSLKTSKYLSKVLGSSLWTKTKSYLCVRCYEMENFFSTF